MQNETETQKGYMDNTNCTQGSERFKYFGYSEFSLRNYPSLSLDSTINISAINLMDFLKLADKYSESFLITINENSCTLSFNGLIKGSVEIPIIENEENVICKDLNSLYSVDLVLSFLKSLETKWLKVSELKIELSKDYPIKITNTTTKQFIIIAPRMRND